MSPDEELQFIYLYSKNGRFERRWYTKNIYHICILDMLQQMAVWCCCLDASRVRRIFFCDMFNLRCTSPHNLMLTKRTSSWKTVTTTSIGCQPAWPRPFLRNLAQSLTTVFVGDWDFLFFLPFLLSLLVRFLRLRSNQTDFKKKSKKTKDKSLSNARWKRVRGLVGKKFSLSHADFFFVVRCQRRPVFRVPREHEQQKKN